jgi:hypothetical protein
LEFERERQENQNKQIEHIDQINQKETELDPSKIVINQQTNKIINSNIKSNLILHFPDYPGDDPFNLNQVQSFILNLFKNVVRIKKIYITIGQLLLIQSKSV